VPIQLAQCWVPRAGHFQTKYIFLIKYTEAILSHSTRKPLRFEISKMLIAFLKTKFIVLLIIIFGTISFPIPSPFDSVERRHSRKRERERSSAGGEASDRRSVHGCRSRRHIDSVGRTAVRSRRSPPADTGPRRCP